MTFVSTVWRLTGANALLAILAIVTSPILARALGPSGRGEVAAIFTVLILAPWIADLGLTDYLARETARGTALGLLLGSVIPVALTAAAIGVAAALPLAHLLGRGREDVSFFIAVGLFMLPINVFIQTLYGVIIGEERWHVIVTVRVLSAVLPATAIVVLSLAGQVTVPHVSLVYLVTALLSNVPLLLGLHRSRPWHFSPRVSFAGLKFGLKSWLTTIATTANARLDQLLMIGFVSSRQLGLYALAATMSGISSSLVAAVANALFPRIASGDARLGARACRISLALVLAFSAIIAAVSPLLVPLIFGSSFAGTVPMLLILLVGSVLLVGVTILNATVTAAGAPGAAARAQTVGLMVTIPGLLIVLPSLGGIGAACVSVCAYAVTLTLILRSAVRLLHYRPAEFLLIRRSDLEWLYQRLGRSWPRWLPGPHLRRRPS